MHKSCLSKITTSETKSRVLYFAGIQSHMQDQTDDFVTSKTSRHAVTAIINMRLLSGLFS